MLEIRHLRYDVTAEDGTDLGILRDVSLTVGEGKLVVITGPNGGGKTTLARTIMGLNQPTGGSIRWNGQDITNLSITDRAKAGVSYGFQQPPRFKGMKVRDLFALAAEVEHKGHKRHLAQGGRCGQQLHPHKLGGAGVDQQGHEQAPEKGVAGGIHEKAKGDPQRDKAEEDGEGNGKGGGKGFAVHGKGTPF